METTNADWLGLDTYATAAVHHGKKILPSFLHKLNTAHRKKQNQVIVLQESVMTPLYMAEP